jgi:hypothetical protein
MRQHASAARQPPPEQAVPTALAHVAAKYSCAMVQSVAHLLLVA